MKHLIPRELRRRVVNIDLVGCGGSGSQLLTELARLHVALKASGHPGLYVTVWDPDTITEASIGRTMFGPSDIGKPKSSELVTRVNCFYGLQPRWTAFPTRYEWPYWHAERVGKEPDFLITTTDSLRSRAEIYRAMMGSLATPPRYWMDLGNDAHTGQVVLGELDWPADPERWERERRERLRTVVDLFPDMLERAEAEEEEPPSCSLVGALGRQSLFINRHVSSWAAELLHRLFVDGGIAWHGVYVNARTGQVNPIPIEAPSQEDVQEKVRKLLEERRALGDAPAGVPERRR